MAVKLHNPGYGHAKKLIADGKVVLDDRDAWSEPQPSAAEENAFIEPHGYAEYGRWHLAIDDERNPDTKGPLQVSATSPLRDAGRRVTRGPCAAWESARAVQLLHADLVKGAG